MSSSPIGPVTLLPTRHLRPTMVVVAGEDPDELAAALGELGTTLEAVHGYRCYRFWVDEDVLVVWTGMGSACLEPLLWEVADAGGVERALLVGTAGTLPGLAAEPDKAFWIHVAKPVWQLLDDARDSLLPRWPSATRLPTAMAVSTDRFYGFSSEASDAADATKEGIEPKIGPTLQAAWRRHKDHPALVDMETAAFFHFAGRFGITWYGAIRSPANRVANLDEMPEHSARALNTALRAALG